MILLRVLPTSGRDGSDLEPVIFAFAHKTRKRAEARFLFNEEDGCQKCIRGSLRTI
jgi:hypothetical protein